MSNPRIEVDVVANVEGVASGVTAATSQLDRLGKAAQSTAPKVDQLSKATSRYNTVGIDFARVIQDAPFGIIGVGNNIQQLAQSFSSLGNSGDSLSSKIKLAFSSIFSSGNLLILAVSAITTAWTFYAKNAEKAETVTDKTREAFEKLANQIDKTAATLGALQFVDKIVEDQLLLNRSTTETSNIFRDFGKATEQAFQKLNPDQLNTIKNTFQELAGVEIQNIGNQLGYNRKEVLQFIKSLEGNDAAFEKLDPKIRDSVQSYNNLQGKVKLATEQLEFFNTKTEKIKGETALEKYSKRWDDFNLAQETARELQEKLTFSAKDYEKAIVNVLTRTESPGIVPQITGDNAWDQYTYSVYQFRDASIQANAQITETSTKALEFGERIKGLEGKQVKIDVKVEGIPDETAGPTPFENFIDSIALAVDKLPEFEQRVADFAFNIADILDANIYEAFADLGSALGEALATGGNVLSAVGKSLLSSVGKLLGDFGKQLIAFGVAGLAYSSLIKSIFTDPVTAAPKAGLAIAAGVALVAISGAIGATMKGNSGAGGGGGSGAGGGSAAQGTSFVGGAQGGLFAQNRDLNGELVVRGQDLVYVFNQANDRINKG